MRRTVAGLLLGAAVGTGQLVTPAAATATTPVRACTAQSVAAEHAVYGPRWGRVLVSELAGDRELLAELGFSSFGDFVSWFARQDPAACPAEG